MIIVGIDPGLKGGIAIINSESPNTPTVYPMPLRQAETKVKKKIKTLTKKEKLARKGGKTIFKMKKVVDSKAFFDILYEVIMATRDIDLVLIEKPLTFATESRQATATTERNYGRLLGILEFVLPLEGIKEIAPLEWKNYFDLSADKEEAIAKTKELFPVTNLKASSRSRTDSDGMAEALLIAEYGRIKNAN
jgi:hypothetical protein